MNPLVAALLLIPSLVPRQAPVSLDARGQDVREALATLFAQAKRPYVLDARIKGPLYASFSRLPLDRALDLVARQANLAVREEGGVILISLLAPARSPKTEAPPKKTVSPGAVLARRVSTRLSRAPLATVFASFGKQAGVAIDLDPKVPAYRIDASFANVPLRSALDQVCKATGLRYRFVGETIRVSVK